jgi:hypothetical protein
MIYIIAIVLIIVMARIGHTPTDKELDAKLKELEASHRNDVYGAK